MSVCLQSTATPNLKVIFCVPFHHEQSVYAAEGCDKRTILSFLMKVSAFQSCDSLPFY